MQQVNAKLKNLRISPRKVRLVIDLVRGKKPEEAVRILKVLNKKSAKPILKLIQSAVANAKHNFNLKEDSLVIKKITADDGPTMRRWMPRAMGRATILRKRGSHVEVVLEGEENEVKKTNKKIENKKEEKETVEKENKNNDNKNKTK